MQEYDYVVIGGGIFGVYAALYLASKKQRVLLLEKEKQLLTKASIVNQARLHSGYHYPRSVATANMSDENKARFIADHKNFINFSFDKFYGIDKHGSFTDPKQFERFCNYLNLKCELVESHPYIRLERLEALFLTTEYSFDPILIAKYYYQKIKDEPYITLNCNTKIVEASKNGQLWQIAFQDFNHQSHLIQAPQVINATYAASNTINKLFNLPSINLMHEIAEMVFVNSPQVKNLGLTIMDGQFGSLMPYGLSGLLSLSSVAYTHHKVSYEMEPHFDCQGLNNDCQPQFLNNCNTCVVKPISNKQKMLSQIRLYLKSNVDLHYQKSMFTIKSKLRANYIDDGRPTEIALLHKNPNFYCIFAGKINSIYEIEKVL